ncbi:hypothetical protein QFZ87_002846 [Bacillus sp. SLBN-46]|uniref:hypothetical protein n=1 Tax=Bacillus sp. SLBN-46 TaxID=3042283 RepID=UPI00286400F6|nr:hypothetical protein [Bacillus sp. SLBN-46]MDR6123249.1 hypothetical protein [Bacillus sp. SLBN-46]
MKKLLTLLFGALIALSLFVTTGNTAKAADNEDCGCVPVVGVERNIIVADLLSSQNFKSAKETLITAGYSFKGVSFIQVAKNNEDPKKTVIIVVVPFYTSDGQVIIAGFVNGEFGGALNPETEIPVLLP